MTHTLKPHPVDRGGSVGYAATDSQRFGRWGLERLRFDEYNDNASLAALKSQHFPSQSGKLFAAAVEACPSVRLPPPPHFADGLPAAAPSPHPCTGSRRPPPKCFSSATHRASPLRPPCLTPPPAAPTPLSAGPDCDDAHRDLGDLP